MATAQVILAEKDDTHAYLSVRVEDDAEVPAPVGPPGPRPNRPGTRPGTILAATEYIVSTPLLDGAGQPKTAQQLRAELLGQVQARRQAQARPPRQALPISGDVEV